MFPFTQKINPVFDTNLYHQYESGMKRGKFEGEYFGSGIASACKKADVHVRNPVNCL